MSEGWGLTLTKQTGCPQNSQSAIKILGESCRTAVPKSTNADAVGAEFQCQQKLVAAAALAVKKGNWLTSKAELSVDVEGCVYLVENISPQIILPKHASPTCSEACFVANSKPNQIDNRDYLLQKLESLFSS